MRKLRYAIVAGVRARSMLLLAASLAGALPIGVGCRRDEPRPQATSQGAVTPAERSRDEHAHDHDHEHDHGADDDQNNGDESSGTAHRDEVRLTPDAQQRYGVRIEYAAARALRPMLHVPGQASFNAEALAHVGSPLRGRVIDLRARLGDVVAKGDVLLVVESAELGEAQSDFLQRRTVAQNSFAAVDAARAALDRATTLYQQDRNIALAELQRRELEVKSAEATAQSTRSAQPPPKTSCTCWVWIRLPSSGSSRPARSPRDFK